MASPAQDLDFMRLALRLAKKGRGRTSPNPMVGAVVTRGGRVIGSGWHQQAGDPHAEIVALRDVQSQGSTARGAVLYVTLEPCRTFGRTPPCTDAIIAAGIKKVVVAATDPNPLHAGRGFEVLRRAGIEVTTGLLEKEATELNEVFNHWIVQRRPYITLKAAMTLDGRIATATGQSRWITGAAARAESMRLRGLHDAILVGVETILADDPFLTWRPSAGSASPARRNPLRRIVLDSKARTPASAKIVTDDFASSTTIFVTRAAPRRRIDLLRRKVGVVVAPTNNARVDIPWVLARLGKEETTSLLVEGGGEVHGSFIESGQVQRIVFFYAPMVLGGKKAKRAIGGAGIPSLALAPKLVQVRWKHLGSDLMLRARVRPPLSAAVQNLA